MNGKYPLTLGNDCEKSKCPLQLIETLVAFLTLSCILQEVVWGNIGPRPLAMSVRRWCLTIWDEVPPQFDEGWMRYLLCGRETCPNTGRLHWQSYLETQKRLTRESVIQRLQCEIHPFVAPSAGDADKNQIYCTKDGEYLEDGLPFLPGERSDLGDTIDAIIEGTTTVGQLLRERPHIVHQYGRTLELAVNERNASFRRDGPPTVYWYWGPTGTGKSKKAHEEAPDAYRWRSNDHGWWDLYHMQKDVILDDFRGNIQFCELLQMLDRYPYSVPRRGKEPIPFLAERIFITSCKRPEDVYSGVGEDIAQLLRRITHIVHFDKL